MKKNERPQDMTTPFQCPVCEKHTFDEYDDYTECPICGWGNEGWQYENPDNKNNYNRMSLNEAREAYKRGEKVE